MNTFSTPIFVPAKAKNEMTLVEALELASNLNAPVVSTSDIYHGAMDDLEEGEEFILVVNGEHHKHEILMRGCNKVGGKLRLMFVNPEKEEVKRLAQWRIPSKHLDTIKNKTAFQLKGFTVHDLRRLIKHCVTNNERQMVSYR